jgi:hypothetical protein
MSRSLKSFSKSHYFNCKTMYSHYYSGGEWAEKDVAIVVHKI